MNTSDIYRFMAVMIFSNTTRFSPAKSIEVLRRLGFAALTLSLFRFISSNLPAYSALSRADVGGMTWDSERDQTQLIGEFKKLAFQATRRIFFNPNHLLATLDDELYVTRARDNQLKTLSARKDDKEGHPADVLVDAFFCRTIAIRFRRCQQPQNVNVQRLLQDLLEGYGQTSLAVFIITGDRGYRKISFAEELRNLRVGSIFIAPSHLIRCHPFAPASFYDPFRDDNEEESSIEDHNSPLIEEDSDDSGDANNEGENDGQDNKESTAQSSPESVRALYLDRP